jgi:hypothetical protein
VILAPDPDLTPDLFLSESERETEISLESGVTRADAAGKETMALLV